MIINSTFLLNLESRPDRLEHSRLELKKHGINYTLIKSIKFDNGRLGLIYTMKRLFEDCLSNGYENILVMEDDVLFLVKEVKRSIYWCVDQLPNDYDMLLVGCNLFQNDVELYSENLIKVTGACATHCIIYSKNGVKKALTEINNQLDNVEIEKIIPLDMIYVDKIQKDGKCFCCYPMIATQINGVSDIENRYVDYNRFLTSRFAEKTKHLK